MNRCLSSARVVFWALVVSVLLSPVAAPADGARKEPQRAPGKVVGLEEPGEATRGPIPIRPPRVNNLLAAGYGRLSITFEGNRKWCTFPDDRLQASPTKTPSGPQRRREVFTFGYQFSMAAVDRSAPDSTILLYSSPMIETASLRQAGKLGRGRTPGRSSARNPVAVPESDQPSARRPRETSATLVPYWDESQRCATLGEQFDFDLEPGLYDLYLSFDIKIRSGAWVHRTYDYLTDIQVEGGSRTRVDALMEMRGGGRRRLELRSASIEPLPEKGAARR